MSKKIIRKQLETLLDEPTARPNVSTHPTAVIGKHQIINKKTTTTTTTTKRRRKRKRTTLEQIKKEVERKRNQNNTSQNIAVVNPHLIAQQQKQQHEEEEEEENDEMKTTKTYEDQKLGRYLKSLKRFHGSVNGGAKKRQKRRETESKCKVDKIPS